MSTEHIDLYPVADKPISTVSDNLKIVEPQAPPVTPPVPTVSNVPVPAVPTRPAQSPADIEQREKFLRQSIEEHQRELASLNSADAVAARLRTIRSTIAQMRLSLEDAQKRQRDFVAQADAQLTQLKRDIPSLHMSNG